MIWPFAVGCARRATLITAVIVLGACGSASNNEAVAPDSGSPPPQTMSNVGITLTSDGAAAGSDQNLADLNSMWSTWSGTDSGVAFDPASNTLTVPVLAQGDIIAVGVRRIDTPLTPGAGYTLAVQSNNQDAAVALFLFDTSGQIVPIATPANSALASAREGQPLRFTAPQKVAGFYLQVQNQWQASDPSASAAQLADSGGAGTTGDNLIGFGGTWATWNRQSTQVASRDGVVVIAPPEDGIGSRYGIRRFAAPLQANGQYEFRLNLVEPNNEAPAALLFLLDDSGQIVPFVDPGTGLSRSWLQAGAEETRRFVAPAGITGFVVQLQSAWGASTESLVIPSLSVVQLPPDVEPDSGPFVQGIPDSHPQTEVQCRRVHRSLITGDVFEDTGTETRSFFVDSARLFVLARSEDINHLDTLHLGGNVDSAYCSIPSERYISAYPPTVVGPFLYTQNRVGRKNGDTEFNWWLTGHGADRLNQLTVDSAGQFKSCQSRQSLGGGTITLRCGSGIESMRDD